MLFFRSILQSYTHIDWLESELTRRWLIHNDDGTLRGPWDAGQIRKALRKGLIDPFVTVSEEGSKQKQELIEIDAIFDTSDDASEQTEASQAPAQATKVVQTPPKAAQAPTKVAQTPTKVAQAPTKVVQTPPKAAQAPTKVIQTPPKVVQTPPKVAQAAPAPKVQAPPPENEDEASFLGLADPSVDAASTTKDSKERRAKVKKFYLIDEKNGKSNMLSAQEISHLYSTKKINNQYRVGKANAKGEISVGKFVKTYKQLSKKGKADKGKRKKSPKTATMAQKSVPYSSGVSLGQNQQQIVILGLLVLLLVVGGVFYFMIRGDIEFFKFQSSDPVEHHELKPRRAIKPQPKPKNDKKDVNLLDAYNMRKNTKPKPRKQKSSISFNPFGSSIPDGVDEDALINEISALKKHNNKLVTLGPLSFQVSELDECEIKCSINMRDDSDREILVIFFKQAYISELEGKSSQVYVEGTVREQGASIYLSKVF